MAADEFLNVNTEVVIERARVAELLDFLLAPFPKPKNFKAWELTGTGVQLLQPVQGLYRPVRVYTFVPYGLKSRVVIQAHCEMDPNRWIRAFQRGRFEKSERQNLIRLLVRAREYKESLSSRDRAEAGRIVEELREQSGLEIR